MASYKEAGTEAQLGMLPSPSLIGFLKGQGLDSNSGFLITLTDY